MNEPATSEHAAEPAERQAAGNRLTDIDRAKGLAIALVVWGHIASFAPIGSPVAFYISISVIYSFHMPLFMYLSGFVFFYNGMNERFWKEPSRFIFNRFDRLIVPFVFFGLLVLFAKYIVGQYYPLPDPVASISDGISSILRDAPDNPSLSIWYLLVIFVYALLTPLLWRLGGSRFLLPFACGILGWVIDLPQDFYITRIASYYLFFALGGFVACHATTLLQHFEKRALLLLAAFVLLCAKFFDHPLALMICGLSSIPAVHGLFRKWFQQERVFLLLGKNSMPIYLMNTLFIGAAGIVSIAVGLKTWALFALLFLAGVVGPMIVKAIVDRVWVLRAVARYLS